MFTNCEEMEKWEQTIIKQVQNPARTAVVAKTARMAQKGKVVGIVPPRVREN